MLIYKEQIRKHFREEYKIKNQILLIERELENQSQSL
jgi:hypothetical protein